MAADDDKKIETDVLSWLKSQDMDTAADYLRSGRKHAHLTDDQLKAAWVLAFERSADDLHNRELRAAYQDFGSEITLRGQEIPLQTAKRAWKKMQKGLKEWMSSLSQEQYDSFAADVAEDLEAFQAKRNNEQN